MESVSRGVALYSFLRRVKKILTTYLEEKQHGSDPGWSNLVEQLLTQWEEDEPSSLLTAHQQVQDLASQLETKGFYFASYLVSTQWLKDRGYGSTTKEKLELACNQVNPFNVAYIYEEIQFGMLRQCPDLYTLYFYTHFYTLQFKSYLPFLSRESLKILDQAMKDSDLFEAMSKEAVNLGKQPSFDTIVEDYRRKYANKSSRLKPKV